MSDVECPYCNRSVEIDTDDGYGLDEGEVYHQECGYCEKTFAFTTCISVDHEAYTADCLNGGEHKYTPIHTYPKEYTRMRCTDCGKENLHQKNVRNTNYLLSAMFKKPVYHKGEIK